MIIYSISNIGGIQMKNNVAIGDIRSLNVNVIVNDTSVVYEGRIENAPIEIKKLKYDKVEVGNITKLFVYDN